MDKSEIALQLALKALESERMVSMGLDDGKLIATLFNDIFKNISLPIPEPGLKAADVPSKPSSDADKVFGA